MSGEQGTVMPLVLLDVDGVLNACRLGGPPRKEAGWDEWRDVKVAGFRILAAEAVLDFVRDLAASSRADVRWLTTWEMGDLVHTDLSPALDLPELPIAGRRTDHPMADWWKLPAAQVVASEHDRRVVWVDDDLPFSRSAVEWCITNRNRVLAVAPDTSLGLTRSDVDRIREFLAVDAPAVGGVR